MQQGDRNERLPVHKGPKRSRRTKSKGILKKYVDGAAMVNG